MAIDTPTKKQTHLFSKTGLFSGKAEICAWLSPNFFATSAGY